ncbi:hypothetical protein [Hyalangium gracile]|uniref:hypothetical protein n=1 Tax=Hyalangium gracile TaxID=394092 RepID=UPI001CCB4571|nr:hypothetical protein [Hyalangium gracile]
MRLRRYVLLSFPILVMAAVACLSEPQYPGDQVLGTFRFDATIDWSRTTCTTNPGGIVQLSDAGPLRFEGTFSRNTSGDEGWLTVQGFSRDADYTGQRVVSVQRVAATLAGCGSGCEGAQIEETLDTLLLSSSQDDLIGRSCARLVDGGVPESDGGVQPPGPTPNGYDVQRACGTLIDDFIPGTKNCTCIKGCRAVYTVEGMRVN